MGDHTMPHYSKCKRIHDVNVDATLDGNAARHITFTEDELTLTVASLLHKLGEKCITLSKEDVDRLRGRTVRVTEYDEGGTTFQII